MIHTRSRGSHADHQEALWFSTARRATRRCDCQRVWSWPNSVAACPPRRNIALTGPSIGILSATTAGDVGNVGSRERAGCPRTKKSMGGTAMKYALGSLLLVGGLALSIGTAKADPLTLTSPQVQDNGTLAVKNACAEKKRSTNCAGANPPT